jgi:hypothetical protein
MKLGKFIDAECPDLSEFMAEPQKINKSQMIKPSSNKQQQVYARRRWTKYVKDI